MKIIFIMSLAGSIMMISILLLEPFIKQFFLFQWQYFLLKITIIFYIVPMPFVNSAYKWTQKHLFNQSNYIEPKVLVITRKNAALLVSETQGVINTPGKVYIAITSIWLMIALFFLIKHIYQYKKYTALVSHALPMSSDAELFVLLNSLKKELEINDNIKVYIEPRRKEAFSMGILNPIIVLPTNMDKGKMKLILRHELVHIKNRDSLVKGTALLVLCIHWFNPFSYILFKMLNSSCEFCCDENVVKDLNRKGRQEYGELIIEMAACRQKYFLPISPIKSNYKEMKRRITCIMSKKHVTKGTKCIALLTSIFLILGCSLTTFAYDEPTKVMNITGQEEAVDQEIVSFSNSDVAFVEYGEGLPIEQSETILYEHQFIDESGNIYNADKVTRASCSHTVTVSGTYQSHYVPGNGSCIVRNYSAKRCSNCGTVIIGNLISESTFPKCIH